MRTIYKYPISADNALIQLALPRGSKVLHGDYQAGGLFIWVEQDAPGSGVDEHRVIFCGTGRELLGAEWGRRRFVNTRVIHEEGLVFHVYDYTVDSPAKGAG
jgi:hypothetical protein